MLQLTDSNYFSVEADQEYCSTSQYKNFRACESMAIARMNGAFKPASQTALLVGSYVHSHFEGSLGSFKAGHPEIFTAKGELKAEYRQANEMINALESDDFAMYVLQGEKEKIFTGEISGVPIKIKVDTINHERKRFTDLKTCRDFEKMWSEELRSKVNFVIGYGYITQMAIYRDVIRQNTGELYSPFMIAVTKQSPPDKVCLAFSDEELDQELEVIKMNLEHIREVKAGNIEAEACGKCEWCRLSKKLSKAIHHSEL